MAEPTVIHLVLPQTDSRLSGHAKGRWQSIRTPTKSLRHLACETALKQSKRILGASEVTYRFYVPDRRRRDAANMIHSQKPAIDGCVDAKIIPGDHWEVLSIAKTHVEVDRKNPRVELIFKEVLDGE